jgi:ribosome modulation factor
MTRKKVDQPENETQTLEKEEKDIREMTADSIGRDILQALVQEIKLLPKSWAELSQAKQDEVIDRLRNRVDYNVKMAVHLIASDNRTTVIGDLESITNKDGIKCTFKVSGNAVGRHELFDSVGKACLLVVADADEFVGGMNDVKGEADQRAVDLGHEYHDNDGGGMDDNVIDTEVREVEYQPSADELKEYYDLGYQAASEGKPESACPQAHGKLCIQWVKGHKKCTQDRKDGPFPNKNKSNEDQGEEEVA